MLRCEIVNRVENRRRFCARFFLGKEGVGWELISVKSLKKDGEVRIGKVNPKKEENSRVNLKTAKKRGRKRRELSVIA